MKLKHTTGGEDRDIDGAITAVDGVVDSLLAIIDRLDDELECWVRAADIAGCSSHEELSNWLHNLNST